jgi:hypothetical protein
MASYSLLASESTVQVLSPTIVNDVVYTTLQTSPSGVIASLPLAQSEFDSGAAGTFLSAFADNIETLMKEPGVIGGQGTQTLDTNGLITDNVSFTVQYVPAGKSGTSITAEAVVPVYDLSLPADSGGGSSAITRAEQIIAGTLANLEAAAGG